MNDQKCELCEKETFFRREIYRCEGRNSKVSLCEVHDKEFFLAGENRMFEKYPQLSEKRTLKKYTFKSNNFSLS